MDKINASRITSSRSLKGATFLLAGWRLSHPKELPGDLPVLLDCHTLTMNMIVLQLSDAVADISMLQCSAQFRILFINAHFMADNAYHALASSATARSTFNVEEEDVVIRNWWTPKEEEEKNIYKWPFCPGPQCIWLNLEWNKHMWSIDGHWICKLWVCDHTIPVYGYLQAFPPSVHLYVSTYGYEYVLFSYFFMIVVCLDWLIFHIAW